MKNVNVCVFISLHSIFIYFKSYFFTLVVEKSPNLQALWPSRSLPLLLALPLQLRPQQCLGCPGALLPALLAALVFL